VSLTRSSIPENSSSSTAATAVAARWPRSRTRSRIHAPASGGIRPAPAASATPSTSRRSCSSSWKETRRSIWEIRRNATSYPAGRSA